MTGSEAKQFDGYIKGMKYVEISNDLPNGVLFLKRKVTKSPWVEFSSSMQAVILGLDKHRCHQKLFNQM